MRKAFTAVFSVICLVGAISSGLVLARYMTKQNEVSRLAELAPVHTTVFVETEDLEGTYHAFKETRAYEDFLRSGTYKAMMKGWEELLKMAEKGKLETLEAMKLDLSERTVMQFIGQNAALGVLSPEGDGYPSFFTMIRLDIAGMAKDTATELSWKDVWERFSRGFAGPDMETESFREYTIGTRRGLVTQIHFTLLDDVLIMSHDKAAVREVIKVHVGETTSVAASRGFETEMGRLPDDPLLYSYFDMNYIRNPERISKTVQTFGKLINLVAPGDPAKFLEEFDGTPLKPLQADLKPIDGLAVGGYVPEGDLYRASWTGSRTPEEVFVQTKDHDVRTLAPPKSALYFEAKGIYDLVVGFKESETLERLLNTEAVLWALNKLKEPEKLKDLFANAPADLPVDAKTDPRFEARMAMKFLLLPFHEIFGNDLAVAIEAKEGKSPAEMFNVVGFLRTRPVLRVLIHLGDGYLQAKAEDNARFEILTHGERTIYGVGSQPVPFYWSRIGANVAFGTQLKEVKAAIDRAEGKLEDGFGKAEDFRTVATHLSEDYNLFAYYDAEAYYHQLLKPTFEQGFGRMEKERRKALLAQLETLYTASGVIAGGMYVDPAYRSIRLETYQPLGTEEENLLRKVYPPDPGELKALESLPEDVFMSTGVQMNLAVWIDFMVDAFSSIATEEEQDEFWKQAEEMLGGHNPRTAFLERLGQHMGFGAVVQGPLPKPDQPEEEIRDLIAVPAGCAALELTDAKAFEKDALDAIRHLIDTANQAERERHARLEERLGEDAGEPTLIGLEEKKVDDHTLRLLSFSADEKEELERHVGRAFQPCFAFVDSFLLVATSEEALTRMMAARTSGKNFASSKTYAKLLGEGSRTPIAFGHFSFDGIIDQVNHNALRLARELAVPPKELKRPERPEFKDVDDPADFEKAYAEYKEKVKAFEKALMEYEREVAKWRAKTADANAEILKKKLDSLRILGHMVQISRRLEDGLKSKAIYELEFDDKK